MIFLIIFLIILAGMGWQYENFANAADYIDLGCWKDTWDRHLKGSNQGRPHDKQSCGAKARELGHKYFSVQDNNECYTGNDQYDRYGRAEGDCPPGGGPWKAHTWEVPSSTQKCAAPMGNPAPEVAGWKYKGCYKDCAAGRGLPNRLDNVTSIEQCIAQAKAKGYNTAGNQFFGECWAGNNTDWDRMGEAGCCEPLGGNCTQQIYTSGQPPPPSTPQKCAAPMGNPEPEVAGWDYKGCYKDCAAGRGLPNRLDNVTSIEQCIAQAKAKGYNTAGNQFFGECWAGNNTDWDRMGDAGCCEPLGGNCTQQIYSLGKAAPPPPPKQVDVIERGLDEQKPPQKGWQSMGKNKISRCYTIRHPTPKSLDQCKDLCLNGDETTPGNNECNTINFQHKTDKTESLCSTHKCNNLNKPNLRRKLGTDAWTWFG